MSPAWAKVGGATGASRRWILLCSLAAVACTGGPSVSVTDGPEDVCAPRDVPRLDEVSHVLDVVVDLPSSSDTVCEPGARQCIDLFTVGVCGEAGAFVPEPCPDGMPCGYAGRCLRCYPGETQCTESGRLTRCGDDGQEWSTEVACPDGMGCAPGLGACGRCGLACVGDHEVLRCVPGAPAYLETCAGGVVCRPSVGCAECLPGAHRCRDDGAVEFCDGDTFRWGEGYACEAGYVCRPGGRGFCEVCDGTQCAGPAEVLTCDAEGEISLRACGDQERCLPGTGCVRCLPYAVRCAGDLQRARCAADGSFWGAEVSCSAEERCERRSGACVPCPAGASICVDAEHRAACGPSWKEAVACGAEERCVAGQCQLAECAADVVLLVDRSESMGAHWAAVEEAVTRLVAEHGVHRFGLVSFPAPYVPFQNTPFVSLPPAYPRNSDDTAAWFAAHGPGGDTPLQPALVTLAAWADALWTLPLAAGRGRALVVLSDGQGNDCIDFWFPTPPGVPPPCNVAGLAAASRELLNTHGVRTYAVGYHYADDANQLRTLADFGGTSSLGVLLADDTPTLVGALSLLLEDPKFCR